MSQWFPLSSFLGNEVTHVLEVGGRTSSEQGERQQRKAHGAERNQLVKGHHQTEAVRKTTSEQGGTEEGHKKTESSQKVRFREHCAIKICNNSKNLVYFLGTENTNAFCFCFYIFL